MSGNAETLERRMALGHKLQWLVAGRVLAAALLLSASILWMRGKGLNGIGNPGDPNLWQRNTLPIAICIFAFSLSYVAALRYSKRFELQAGLQFFFDILLVTWFVWATGDIDSPYAAIYIIVISVASIYLGARGALVTSGGCAATYSCMMLLIAFGLLAPLPARTIASAGTSLAETIHRVALNDVAFFAVGLLAARLAERNQKSDVSLIEAKHKLARFQALHERIVESIRSGVMTTDLQGHIYTFNQAAEEITERRAVEVRGREASLLFGDLNNKIEASMQAAANGAPSPRFEADSATPEGLRLRLGFSISPLFAESGETTGLVITFQDLTEVRALEETSRRQDRLAAVGRVAAGIAHEIRNPLAAMSGSVQVLRAEVNGNAGQAELMDIVLRESDRLNRIISDFLTYARPRSVSLAEIDIREPLRETFTLLRHSPEIHSHHQLREDVPDEPVRAMADGAQMKQVFWNLARNALQAMPDGGTLQAKIQSVAPDRARITFTDTGRGMSPEQVQRLFEPFSSSKTGGTGLGLSIVDQIVRVDHGGIINVRSREDHGTTITIELPGPTSKTMSDERRTRSDG